MGVHNSQIRWQQLCWQSDLWGLELSRRTWKFTKLQTLLACISLSLRSDNGTKPLPGPILTQIPGEGTPSMLGDTYMCHRFDPIFDLMRIEHDFRVYFFSSTNTKTIFWGTRIRSFWLQIPFLPRSFRVKFLVTRGTPHRFSDRVPTPVI